MTTLYSDLDRTTGGVGGSCAASTSSFSSNVSVNSPQTSQQSVSAVSAAVAVAAAELRQHHQQSVVSSSQSIIINGNPPSSSVSTSSSSSMSSSSSNISSGSPISSSPQSNPNSSMGTPSVTGSPSSSTNLVDLSNCTSSSSGISSLSGVSINGVSGGSVGSRVGMGSNSTLIEDPRTLQLALELSMVGLSDTMQAAAVAVGLNNGNGHTHRQQQQQQQHHHLSHHLQQQQQQQQLQSQQINTQYDLTCALANASASIMQPSTVLPPGTTLNQFAASILPTLEDRSKKSQNMTECVPVPSSEHVAEIVGRQGCKIKALRAKTNTYIKTPVRGEEPVFVVTGRKEDVAKAKREILSAAEHFSLIRASRKPVLAGNLGKIPPGPPSIPGQVTIQVRVPYRVVGLVVGPKGATIKHIQQETHTYIVTPSREKEPIFEVTGLPDNVQAARKQIEAHIALRTGNLSPSVQTINSLNQMFNGEELSPEFLASIYKNGICSTFDYVDAQISLDEGSGCNMVVPNQGIGAFNGNSNHHLQQHQQQQHQLHQAGSGVVSASNLVMSAGMNGAMMSGNGGVNNNMVNSSVNGNSIVAGVSGTSIGGSRSCSSSSSSTSSKSATNSRPELMNIWKNLGESLDIDEGLGESPNIWTLSSATGPIGCSPSQSVSPTDSLLGGAGGSTGSNNISNMISSTAAANIIMNNGNRVGLISTTSQQQLNGMRRECLVCGDKEVTAALVPCGHNMFCMECANHICTSVDGCCPVCSQTVYHAMRILP